MLHEKYTRSVGGRATDALINGPKDPRLATFDCNRTTTPCADSQSLTVSSVADGLPIPAACRFPSRQNGLSSSHSDTESASLCQVWGLSLWSPFP